MAEIAVVRTARKTHHCDTQSHRCARTIQPGERYAHYSLPPNSDMGNEGWWTAKTCAACAIAYDRPIAAELADTVPSRPHVDEPRLDRPIVNVPLPALEATNA